jgi:quinol monooxygenase YgiN
MRVAPGFLLAVTIAAIGGAPAARAQEVAYVVSYVEAAASSKDAAAAALRQLAALGRQAEGNVRFEVLQNTWRPQHFAVVEAWKDQGARKAHEGSPRVKQVRDELRVLLTSPPDERPHVGHAVGQARPVPADAVFVVTHVDFIPPKKDEGIAALKALVDVSRGESGNVRFDVLQQSGRPNHLTLVEVWTDLKALEAHEEADRTRKIREGLLPSIGSPYDERIYVLMK